MKDAVVNVLTATVLVCVAAPVVALAIGITVHIVRWAV